MSMAIHCYCHRCAVGGDPDREYPRVCGRLVDTKYETYEVSIDWFDGSCLVCSQCALFCWAECVGRAGYIIKAQYPGELNPPPGMDLEERRQRARECLTVWGCDPAPDGFELFTVHRPESRFDTPVAAVRVTPQNMDALVAALGESAGYPDLVQRERPWVEYAPEAAFLIYNKMLVWQGWDQVRLDDWLTYHKSVGYFAMKDCRFTARWRVHDPVGDPNSVADPMSA